MATPLTLSIPPLRVEQIITAWQPLFIAAASALEDRAAVKLLPAYVKRGRLEGKVVLRATEKETLAEAFTYLKERLDPEENEFAISVQLKYLQFSVKERCKFFVYDRLPNEPNLTFYQVLNKKTILLQEN